METKMTVHQSGLHLPISQAFINILYEALSYSPPSGQICSAVVINFRDQKYSAESGGFHPVEIRLIYRENRWYYDYITDFSFIGGPWPELEKEMDISWSQQYLWHYLIGYMDPEEGGALFELWQRNFIQYWRMNIYTVSIQRED
jgi:hypothetical protein